jgi:UDP-GlcNAc3NAcA epimerase
MKCALVLGTRPQIIKSAPIVHAASECPEMQLDIVHTGQHYDYEMSKRFFDEMSLPEPVTNLNVGSGPHGWQTGEMVMRIERCLLELKPDVVIVPGDANSTLAGALAAVKMHLKVAHVEAGARSYNTRMPEEINRRLTDHCADLLFAVTWKCAQNLKNEGIAEDWIHRTGDTMYDVLLQHMPYADEEDILEKLGLERQNYVVLTLHRQENVDSPPNLMSIVEAMMNLGETIIVFPIHPRTRSRLNEAGLLKRLEKARNIVLVSPVKYSEMLKLTKHARLLFTDSGGLQKEAFWLRTPCITLRENTEWTETVELGANTLVGAKKGSIVEKAREELVHGKSTKGDNTSNPFGDGKASEKILRVLKNIPSE